ncbi:MAG: hypothetical protein D6765_02650 [Bacteroidetes bacterium]|nr:MAG: hypothetical protein D6765_02650 [Bacteroidota bacterium]
MPGKKPRKKTTPKQEKPKVHKDLEGFDIRINEFGEIVPNVDIDKLNQFLNENVDDKKLRNRTDRAQTPPSNEEE